MPEFKVGGHKRLDERVILQHFFNGLTYKEIAALDDDQCPSSASAVSEWFSTFRRQHGKLESNFELVEKVAQAPSLYGLSGQPQKTLSQAFLSAVSKNLEKRGLSKAQPLTAPEKDIVKLVAQGMDAKAIAEAIIPKSSPGSIRARLCKIYEKTGMSDHFALSIVAKYAPEHFRL